MGSPEFSIAPLTALLKAGYEIIAVFSQPPKAAGRGQEEQKTAVHKFAQEQGITVFTPKNFSETGAIENLQNLKPEIIIVVAYGLLLPKMVLESAKFGCINIHASLLPSWRGAAPIQRALLAGDTKTGITIMQMDAGLDTGEMLLLEEIPITSSDTAATLHDRLSQLGAELIVEALPKIQTGEITKIAQNNDHASYAAKIKKAEAEISFDFSAEYIERKIRSFTPWPGAYAFIKNERVKILAAVWNNDSHQLQPGTIIDNEGWIACKTGKIRPIKLQRSGKNPLDYENFCRGFQIHPGQIWNQNAAL
jgi:methionyl-tRNA formyltransferase